MKRVLLLMVIFFTFGCNIFESESNSDVAETDMKKVNINFSEITGLLSPTVDYDLKMLIGGRYEDYEEKDGTNLTEGDETYVLNLNLKKGHSYKFAEFTIKENSSEVYTIDTNNTSNIGGFTINSDGTTDPATIKIYLLKVDPYNDDPVVDVDITVETDEMPVVDLTFKITLNNTSNPILQVFRWKTQGEPDAWEKEVEKHSSSVIYDMDTDAEYVVTEEDNGDLSHSFYKDEYKIVACDSISETSMETKIYYDTSANLNGKNIIFDF